MNIITDDHDDNSMNQGLDLSFFLEVAILLITTLELESSGLELITQAQGQWLVVGPGRRLRLNFRWSNKDSVSLYFQILGSAGGTD